MRADMYEVLIERPRRGMRTKHARTNKPQVRDWDGEDGFEDRVAPRQQRTRHFDDHLQPLRRWLRAQVNRPWDKVYAELCASIDRRSTTGQHLLDHVDDEVVRDARIGPKGEPLRPLHEQWRRHEPVYGLYVDPRTGLLRWRERHRLREQRERRDAERRALAETLIALGDGRFLWNRGGLWYEVRARHCEPARAERMDFRHPDPRCCLRDHDWHVTWKRQLAARELRERQLQNTATD